MKIQKKRESQKAEGDMTPMIDMTFQLIAFFMVLINFSEVEQNQEINLPESELAKPPEVAYEKPVTLQMTKDEQVLFGGEKLSLEQTATALLREAAVITADGKTQMRDVTVVIRADAEARAGKVQEMIEIAQEAKFETFALRGQTTSESTLGE
jgi:biopolymer transport protein ExbD